MEKQNVALFGLGTIGLAEAREWANLANLRYIIDSDPSKKSAAEKLGAEFVCMDIRQETEAGSSGQGGSKLEEIAANTSVWSISTNTDSHEAYLRETLRLGIKKVFIEKASTNRPEISAQILKEFQDSLIQVNYVELAHPVLLAIVDHMKQTGFSPMYFFNWRGKDLRGIKRGLGGGEGSRICLEDLTHDISEIALIREKVNKASFSDSKPIIRYSNMRTWQELGYPYPTDVHAEIGLMFKDASMAYIRGGFAENAERRYFLVSNGDNRLYQGDTAYFGQTLTRGEIDPVAAIIKGVKNVEAMFNTCKEGLLINKKAISYWLNKANAEPIDISAYAMADKVQDGKAMLGLTPIARMVENLANAKSNSELICPLSRAVTFEKLAEQAYHRAGRPEAMVFRALV